ncbi:hypothetical protein G6F61_013306 [Rhizopus arrhizus]|nr:hypothetical protein G6F42_026365 [Rhizopus arrhizus]KAG1366118.1 hypothetical protein G6F61_013306 [Rhizopus arrhizus]
MDRLLSSLHTTINTLRPLQTESSRCTIKSGSATNRMVSSNILVSTVGSTVGSPPGGLVCLSQSPPSSSIRLVELPSPCLVDKCLQSTVESHPRSPLPSSPVVSHYTHPTDSSSPPTTSNDDYSESAISPMVPSRSPADQVSTNPDHRPVDSRKRFRPTSITEEQEVDPSLKRLRLSSQALSVINSSTSSFSENSPYVQTTFIDWCEVRGIDYTLPSVFSVLSLLAEQRLLENWKTSTVFTYASSILQLYTCRIYSNNFLNVV